VITLKLEGLKETSQYKAWKFPGGEVHVKFSESFIEELDNDYKDAYMHVHARIESSDDLMLLLLVLDTLAEDWDSDVVVYLAYMPYAQADRRFARGESFSLRTVSKMLNAMPFVSISMFDPHSDVAPALFDGVHVEPNNEFIKYVLAQLPKDTMLLSPDAGAYKKIFKLASEIEFKGAIQCCNKYRDSKGNLSIQVPNLQYHPGPVLIIDDICLGGKTFLTIADKLREGEYYGDLYLAVSHGIFSNGTEHLAKAFRMVFTTNSRYTGEHAGINGTFKVI
jgi:ribose-phosphate pyrophosphokinase